MNYKDEEVQRYRLTQKNFLGEALINEIINVFYCKKQTMDEDISVEIMNFATKEAANDTFQMYAKLMEDTYNERYVHPRGIIYDYIPPNLMSLGHHDDYSVMRRVYRDNSEYDDLFILRGTYFIQIHFMSHVDEIYYQNFIEFLDEMGLPDPRTEQLLEYGAEQIIEE